LPPDAGDDEPLPDAGDGTLGAVGVGTVLVGAGIASAGGEDSVTTGAWATAPTSAATTGVLAGLPDPAAAAAAGTSEYVEVTTGTRRRTRCRRRTTTRCLTVRRLRTVRTAGVEAVRNAGGATARWRWSAGTASCGNLATATDSAGSGWTGAGASSAALNDAPTTPM
jgi:hypothetical protein